MRNTVIIQFEVEGFHSYKNAPEQVSFLRDKHRHTFRVKAGYKVSGLDREKEIFIMRELVKEYLLEAYGYPCNFGNMSCEMIALEIMQFSKEDGMIWCEVWEEETGGARVEL